MTQVQPIMIRNKPYIQVAGRVTLAHSDEGFSMLSSETFELANRYFCRVTIAVKDRQFIGSSEIKFGAKPGTADGDSPLECAETSALGRALGAAGYGSVESLASADEVLRNEQQRQSSDELNAIMAEVKMLKLASDVAEWQAWKVGILGQAIPNKQLTAEHLGLLRSAIEEHKMAGIPGAA